MKRLLIVVVAVMLAPPIVRGHVLGYTRWRWLLLPERWKRSSAS
jgi:hypothetical protein